MEQPSGIVFDIQRFCVHDGPGIRTTVFFKGCPLACGWCHNPEGMCARPQVMFDAEKCIGCGACLAACACGVHAVDARGGRAFRARKCAGCGACARACPAGALTLSGKKMTAEEVMEAVMRDRAFFGADGGVTFSGGEALMQAAFLEALLALSRAAGLNTAVDTSGYAPWSALEATLKKTDLYLYDIKAFTPALHRALTGVDNARILENLRRLDAAGARVWIRMPLVRGLNDTEAELEGTARLLAQLSCVEKIELLPYHVLGRAKYAMLGGAPQRPFYAPEPEKMRAHRALFARFGLGQVS